MSSRRNVPLTETEQKFQAYFTALAPNYGHLTGNATRNVLLQVLNDVPLGVNGYAVIHDNAAGPGTASSAILEWCAGRAYSAPAITATDHTQAMIDALNAKAQEAGGAWKSVAAHVMDSHDLKLKDDTFTYSFCNFSIGNFARPLHALWEIHRTLKPGGIAILTAWKTFGFGDVMDAARRSVKGADTAKIPVPGAEFMEEGHLAKLVDEAGWEVGKIKTMVKKVVVKGEDLDGAIEFMTGDYSAMARADFTDDDKAKWPAAVKDAVEEAKSKHGGILCEAWVVLAKRWDAQYA